MLYCFPVIAQAPDVQAQRPWLTGPATPQHVGSSRTGARTRVPCIGRRTLNHCATREAPELFFLIDLYWSIIASQYYVSFCCTTKKISHMHTHVPISPPSWASLPSSLSHPSRSSQSTELISLCYAVAFYYSLAALGCRVKWSVCGNIGQIFHRV